MTITITIIVQLTNQWWWCNIISITIFNAYIYIYTQTHAMVINIKHNGANNYEIFTS